MASMTMIKCAYCGKEREVRTADVARGWGKFCSKSCKAKRQEKLTGQNRDYRQRRGDDNEQMHDQAMDDSTQGWGEGGWLKH